MKNNSLLFVITLMFVLCACPPPPPPPPPVPPPTSVTDIDGNTYSVKQFGTTIWMTENLRVTRYDTLSPRRDELIAVATYEHTVDIEKPYYIDVQDFKEPPYTDNLTKEIRKSLGLLYNWSAAAGTQTNNTTVGSGTQGICPNGWVLPTNDDYQQLLDYIGDPDISGQKLKSISGWYTNSGSGTDKSGMHCYPAGLAANNFVSLVGQQTMFWSLTSSSGYNKKANVLKLFYDSDETEILSVNKFQANSVRCVYYISVVPED
ncbi:MAG: fibrobacter succinogenes major paralogous domain-containing protein [Bacteroidetes bacterium]|nr:fibrobacter succinogenes major paralogous domain-containing protein [Bacteroidota bacterium]MCL1968220.1 fibrobacter succinogenes major paralogous domain-containing protein [Bacteroidota bacterium]